MRFQPSPYLLLVVATVIWGGNFVVGRAVHSAIPPLGLTFWRWVISGLILLAFTAPGIWAHRDLILKHFRLLFALAFSGMAIFHSFVYIALGTTTAINATLVLASMPLVIPVVSYLFGEERLSLRQGAGIAISFIGVGTIITRGDMSILLNLAFAPGDLWILGAVVAWSVYSVMLRRVPKELPPLVMLGAINLIAIAILVPPYLVEVSTTGGFELNPPNVLALGYVAIFASIVAFISWNKAVAVVGANRAGLFIHVIPLSSAILAILFLGENLELYHLMGLAPIVIGIILTTTGPKTGPKTGSKNTQETN